MPFLKNNILPILGIGLVFSSMVFAQTSFADTKLRAGEWEQTITTEYIPPLPANSLPSTPKVKTCVDQKTLDLVTNPTQSLQSQGFKVSPVVQTGNTYNYDVTAFGQIQHYQTTILSDTEYQTVTKMPKMVLKKSMKYLGACPTGMAPGDVVVEDSNGHVEASGNGKALGQELLDKTKKIQDGHLDAPINQNALKQEMLDENQQLPKQ